MGERGHRVCGRRGPARRASRGLALLSVLAVGCRAQVAGGLDEAQANEVLVHLQHRGLGADKESSGPGDDARFAVTVPSGELGRAAAVLTEESLPRTAGAGLASTYGEPGLVPSPLEESARFDAAVAAELSATLERMPGVRSARVHVARPVRPTGLVAPPPAATRAAVLVTHAAGARPSPEAIARLVSGAIEGLSPAAVEVVCVAGSAPATTATDLRRVGPFLVARGSATPLGLTLALGLVGYAALALAVVRARRTV